MSKKRLLVLTLLIVLVGCTVAPASATAPPTATLPAMPTNTPEPVPTATPTFPPVEWVSLPDAKNLALHPSWASEGGTIVDGKLEMKAQDSYFTAVNTRGPYITFDQDWGVSATIEVAFGDEGAVVLYGALPDGAWWKGIRRLDLSWNGSALEVIYWDGSAQSPGLTKTVTVGSVSGPVQIQVRSTQGQLFFLVDETPVGQMDDPGLTPNRLVYLGTNVPPNATLIVHEIAVEAARGKEDMVQVVSPVVATYVPSSPSLRELAAAHGLLIGTAVSANPLRGEAPYAQALAHEFNVLTTENAMKFGPIHPAPDRYAFANADAIVDFAEEHDMQVHGHTLVWHQQTPKWITEGEWTREELIEVLHEHITTVVGRYRGQVDAWDVVNEAIDKGTLRETVWKKVIGPDYIDLAFQWAHEADPEALLFYNDYGGEGTCPKSDAIYELVQGMVARGVPIHGVGLQMHLKLGGIPKGVLENMDRLADLSLEVRITELDIRLDEQGLPDKLEQQARDYRTVVETCLEAKRCTAVIMWGFTDRHSWIPSAFEGYGEALIFDEAYLPKPAYHALKEALTTP